MALPQSTISHQLQRLEKRSLLRRRRAHDDNRLVAITLTRKGISIARQCNQLSLAVHRHIARGLSEAELSKLMALFAKASKALEEFGSPVELAKKSAAR